MNTDQIGDFKKGFYGHSITIKNKLSWLLGRKSKLSISNKLLVYEVILKPIWTCGMQLWGSASISNIEILEMERFQGKVLRMITDAPWYVMSMVLRPDLQMTSVKEEIRRFSTQQPHSSPRGTTRPQATETTSAHQISCVNVI
jgi:hypothetical protein